MKLLASPINDVRMDKLHLMSFMKPAVQGKFTRQMVQDANLIYFARKQFTIKKTGTRLE